MKAKMSSRKGKTMTKSIFLLLQFIFISSQFQDVLSCNVQKSSETLVKDPEKLAVRSTIFDPRVLNTVKTLFARHFHKAKTTSQTGQKKSIITTAGVPKVLHVKIDPRQFGKALLNQANGNAVRKSDIYMDKAIDATALGVAVLKLIFGKDAKMVMKDAGGKDTKASLRTTEPRPRITLWSHSAPEVVQTGDKKSLGDEKRPKGTDKVGRLSLNILKLVKNLRPSRVGGTKNGEPKSGTDSASQGTVKDFSGSEGNLERLLSLMEEGKGKGEKGNKKSWVLLKVPEKQPKDELGMLTDPVATEVNSNDDLVRPPEEETHTSDQKAGETHRKRHKKKAGRLLSKIQDQVQHLANLVSKDKGNEKQTFVETKQVEHPETASAKQQSYEGKSLRTSKRLGSKSLKTEPFHEVNPVKSDRTAHVSYENSVKNLLNALETSAHKHSSNHVSKDVEESSHIKSQNRKLTLVPLKKKEEHAASKDVLGGTNTLGGAVVSLDALRQLGQLLGLSSQNSREKKISPYTGTQDTLTLATAMPPEQIQALQNPTPTPPAPTRSSFVPTTPPLNRISEQLKMFAERGLRSHNDYRRLHHSEPLKWSEDLATAAEKLAYQAAKKGTTARSELVEQKGYGENVAKIPFVPLENAGEEATRHWYNEKQNFTFSDPVIDDGTKSFTQIIWKGTQRIGMGAAKDDDTGELYVVALYDPKGNDQATLRENLLQDGAQHTDVYASIFKKSYAARHE